MNQPRALRVLIVHNQDIVRRRLSILLSRREDVNVVGEVSSAAEAKEHANQLEPDVALVDSHLQGESGIQASREIRGNNPNVKVLMLTSHSDDRAIIGSVLAGAAGYLLKELRSQDVLMAIRRAAQGQYLLNRSLVERLLERVSNESQGSSSNQLTESENDILALVVQGRNNREIGERERLGEDAVQEYIISINDKLEAVRRFQAATYAADLRDRRPTVGSGGLPRR